MNELITTNASQAMSSREIAELVESRHDSVKRAIERLADRSVITRPPMVDESYTDSGEDPCTILTAHQQAGPRWRAST